MKHPMNKRDSIKFTINIDKKNVSEGLAHKGAVCPL
jgi:hypothetical protein